MVRTPIVATVERVQLCVVLDNHVQYRPACVLLKIRRPKLALLGSVPAIEIDQLQLSFFVFKNESGYIFLCNMIEILGQFWPTYFKVAPTTIQSQFGVLYF